jgi:putative phosphoesterase
MKILVLSDSHGSKRAICDAVRAHNPHLILHLGDYVRDCRALEIEFPNIDLRTVRGNGDLGAFEPEVDEFVVGGKRIFMTHGHLYHVKTGLEALVNNGMLRRADIVLFGHTHRPYSAEFDGMLVVNPGTAGLGRQTCALLEIENGAVTCEIKELE